MKTLNTQELEYAVQLILQAAKRDLTPNWWKKTEVLNMQDFEAASKQLTDLLKATRKAGGCLTATAILQKSKSAIQPSIFDR